MPEMQERKSKKTYERNPEKRPLTYTLSDAGYALPQPEQKPRRKRDKKTGRAKSPHSAEERIMNDATQTNPQGNGAPIQSVPAPTPAPVTETESKAKANLRAAGHRSVDVLCNAGAMTIAGLAAGTALIFIAKKVLPLPLP